MSGLLDFTAAVLRTATPLLLAAEGELLVERAGLINLGLEGAIIGGAFGAVVGAGAAGVGAGFVIAALVGAATALLVALAVIVWRTDAIIAGTAVTMLALGLTGTLYRAWFGASGVALSVPTTASTGPTILATLLLPTLWWFLYRTHAGLALRASGEAPEAARAAGHSPTAWQASALALGGALGGCAGATLVLSQVGTFAEGMSAGRGFIAIAVVVLGRWSVSGIAMAALVFGAASQAQYLFQSLGWQVPYQLFLALPYLLTLIVLALTQRHAVAPGAVAR